MDKFLIEALETLMNINDLKEEVNRFLLLNTGFIMGL